MILKTIYIIKNLLRFTSRILFQNKKGIEDFKRNYKANKILVISLTHLGDMVLLSPFLYNLRKNFPKAQIDILFKKQVAEILEYCPHINNRIIYNAKWVTSKRGDGFVKTFTIIRQLKRRRYDLCFVTHAHIFSNMISWLARIPFRVGYSDNGDSFLNIILEKGRQIQHARNCPLNLLRHLGLKVESDKLEFYLGPQDVSFAEEFRRKLYLSDTSFLIGIHPGAGDRKRIWRLERYAEVIQYLVNKYNAHILLFAGKQEVDIIKEIKFRLIKKYWHRVSDLSGITTLHQMAALMMVCKVILVNDAGPMHIASALDKPTVALFIGTPDYWSKIWGPLSENSRVVSKVNVKVGRPEDIKIEDVIRILDELIGIKVEINK